MKIVIINGSARRGNTLTAIDAFVKGASEKNEIVRDVGPVNVIKDVLIRMIQIPRLIKLLLQM